MFTWIDGSKSSGVESLDSGLDSLLAADHHYHCVRRPIMNMRHQFQAANASHVYVAKHKVKI